MSTSGSHHDHLLSRSVAYLSASSLRSGVRTMRGSVAAVGVSKVPGKDTGEGQLRTRTSKYSNTRSRNDGRRWEPEADVDEEQSELEAFLGEEGEGKEDASESEVESLQPCTAWRRWRTVRWDIVVPEEQTVRAECRFRWSCEHCNGERKIEG